MIHVALKSEQRATLLDQSKSIFHPARFLERGEESEGGDGGMETKQIMLTKYATQEDCDFEELSSFRVYSTLPYLSSYPTYLTLTCPTYLPMLPYPTYSTLPTNLRTHLILPSHLITLPTHPPYPTYLPANLPGLSYLPTYMPAYLPTC